MSAQSGKHVTISTLCNCNNTSPIPCYHCGPLIMDGKWGSGVGGGCPIANLHSKNREREIVQKEPHTKKKINKEAPKNILHNLKLEKNSCSEKLPTPLPPFIRLLLLSIYHFFQSSYEIWPSCLSGLFPLPLSFHGHNKITIIIKH